jgi:hypothetical protein
VSNNANERRRRLVGLRKQHAVPKSSAGFRTNTKGDSLPCYARRRRSNGARSSLRSRRSLRCRGRERIRNAPRKYGGILIVRENRACAPLGAVDGSKIAALSRLPGVINLRNSNTLRPKSINFALLTALEMNLGATQLETFVS